MLGQQNGFERPINLPKDLKKICKIVSQLPENVKARIIGGVLATVSIKATTIPLYIEYFPHALYGELEVEIESFVSTTSENTSFFHVKSFYLEPPVRLTTSERFQVPPFLKTQKIKKVVFSDDMVTHFTDTFLPQAEEVLFEYRVGSPKLMSVLPVFPSSLVTEIECLVKNSVPPFEMIKHCQKLKLLRLRLAGQFSDFDTLRKLSLMVKLEIHLYILKSQWFDDFLIKITQLENCEIVVEECVLPSSENSLSCVKQIEINRLTVDERYKWATKLKKLNSIVLTVVPPAKYKLNFVNLKELVCEPPIDKKIDFSFRKMTKLQKFELKGNIGKHSFETLPLNLSHLSITGPGEKGKGASRLDLSNFRMPKGVQVLEFADFSIDLLPDLKQLPRLHTLNLTDVSTCSGLFPVGDKKIRKWWSGLSESVRSLVIEFTGGKVARTTHVTLIEIQLSQDFLGLEIKFNLPHAQTMILATSAVQPKITWSMGLFPMEFTKFGAYIKLSGVTKRTTITTDNYAAGVFCQYPDKSNITVGNKAGVLCDCYNMGKSGDDRWYCFARNPPTVKLGNNIVKQLPPLPID
ncbi:unnamed protein product [Ambrosiozyma monospora]|uniref:Unnamed protein product n=1 Tax=Ambrosiozyma monospora TaxID=43982 RepID=A0A9W6YRV0_AMBMO|nr:unnamed protein product [Ambrosiozyma monospora]